MDTPFHILLAISILVPVVAFTLDVYRVRSWNLALSLFWFFTLIWLVAFPLKALALVSGFTTSAARRPLSVEDLTLAMGLSFLLWLAVLIGNFWNNLHRTRSPATEGPTNQQFPTARLALALFLSIAVSLPMSLLANNMNTGPSYFSYRIGMGYVFLLAELVPLAVIAAAIPVMTADFRQRGSLTALIAFSFSVAASLPVTILLSSRRIFAACLLSLVVGLALRSLRLRWLALLGVLGTIFGSVLLQAVRYADIPAQAANSSLMEKAGMFFSSMRRLFHDQVTDPAGGIFKSLFDSFEGIEHAAALFQRASWQQLLFGIDHGMSWIYNAGLSLFPRAIWASKPLIYGNNAQQFFLYPEWFRDGLMIVAMPPSFVVDFVFGFGVVGAIVLALGLGRILRAAESFLIRPDENLAARAFSLFLFINLFNVVRSGTSIIQAMIPFAVIVLAIYGWRVTTRGILGFGRYFVGRKSPAP